MTIQPFDRDALRRAFMNASPFPFAKIDDFLDPEFAQAVAAAYPKFDDAMKQGRSFKAVNEKKKIQITDASKFPEPVAKLNELLASPVVSQRSFFYNRHPRLGC